LGDHTISIVRNPGLASAIAVDPPTGILSDGQAVSLRLIFTEPVFVTGSPKLQMSSGRLAFYDSGSGTAAIRFLYSAVAGERAETLGLSAIDNVVMENSSLTDAAGNQAVLPFVEADPVPCFMRGTRIATAHGDIAVEDLRVGDLVTTTSDGAQAIKWIGTRSYLMKHVEIQDRIGLMPFRIEAGALGKGRPVRDLFVSPEHMVCLDGVLVPAKKLQNDTSIVQVDLMDVLQYFHVELAKHCIIFAEGAPVESYLDTGNRNMFGNVLSYLDVEHVTNDEPAQACLPIVTGGGALNAIRASLATREDCRSFLTGNAEHLASPSSLRSPSTR
jgi:hypothetical protein